MESETRRFLPCVRGQHTDCTRAYFGRESDGMGSYEVRIVCSCTCHRQTTLFAAPPAKQSGLFRGPLFGGAR